MASIIIKNAAKGQGKAMTALYEANKQKLYAIAKALLLEEGQAAAATAGAFREVWSTLKSAKLTTPEEFTAYAVSKVADQCKRSILMKNPKALRVPHGKNFQLPSTVPVKDSQADELSYLLTNLPAVQRFVLVLHTLGELTNLQIALLLNMDLDLIQASIDAEAGNLQTLQALSSKGYSSSYSQIVDALSAKVAVSEKAEKACKDTIASLAAAAEGTLKKQQTTKIIIIAAAIVCVVLITLFGILASGSGDEESSDGKYTSTSTNTTNTNTDSDTDADPDIPVNSAPALDKALTYYADIDIADYGKITVKLDQAAAPATCANFVNLAKTGFYDGLTFHRIMEGFMMQGGCPDGTGGGSAKENVVGEFSANGYKNDLSHTRGAISMARATPYNSASSQFFIVHEDSVSLDGQYACFGYVTEGMDVVDAVCTKAEPTDNNGTIPAAAQPVITSITIRTESAN